MFLAWFKILSRVSRLLKGKIAKIVIYDSARVKGRTNYDYSGQHYVPKLVHCKVITRKLWDRKSTLRLKL